MEGGLFCGGIRLASQSLYPRLVSFDFPRMNAGMKRNGESGG
jgi:hypothetical protein